jgi:hypothetical protein
MKPWHRFALRLTTVASVLSAAGCDQVTGLIGPEQGWARVTGEIRDATNRYVAGATVSIPYGQGLSYSDVTDGGGRFSFDVQASDFTGISPVAVVVYKDRYLPKTYYFTSINDQDVFELKPDATDATRPLEANELVPQAAQSLWHIGDDDFNGASNSKLQVAATGTSAGYFIMDWTAQTRAQYHSATISLVGRGIDTSRYGCANRFGVYVEAGGGTSYTAPGDSDANGGFSAYRFNVNLPATLKDGRLMFGAIAGTCTGGNGYDDWEFAETLLQLNP